MKLKVQVLSGNSTDACSLYRCFGPFQYMHRNDEVELIDKDMVGWRHSSMAHILFVQRPHIASELAAMETAKNLGIPVIVDYDDPLAQVPVYNPTWQKLKADQSYIANTRKALHLADKIWVSTPALKESFLRDDPRLAPSKIEVISNGWNFRDWKFMDKPSDGYRFIWRGTNTHDKDLWEITEPLADAILQAGATGADPSVARGAHGEGNHMYSIMCIGGPFWMSLEEWAEQEIDTEVHSMSPFVNMLALMRRSRARFGLVPLSDNLFNNCKSNIAALEYLACGQLPITASRDEFVRIPGIIASDNYASSLAAAMGMSDGDRHARWRLAAEWMRDECRLEQRNKERMASMLSLVG